MSLNLEKPSLLTLLDYTPNEIQFLLNLSARLKKEKKAGQATKHLQDKNIALLFEKPSTRTRCAFSVACADQGAHSDYLGKSDIHLGLHETVEDTARVLGRMYDGIAFRGFSHTTVEKLASLSGIPVWNALTDKYHPTQILADFFTISEQKGRLKGIKLAYCGDGSNNVANSLMIGSAKMGLDLRIITDKSLFPKRELFEKAQALANDSGARITQTEIVDEAIEGVDVIYNDVWASMGEESIIAERIKLLKPYQVNHRMVDLSGNPEVIYMHCLPCNHNADTQLSSQWPEICETTEEIFESDHSKVFDQAENRLHTIKAVMVAALNDYKLF